MIIVAAAVLVVLSVPLLGGSLRRLADLHLRAPWLLFLALGIQILVTTVLPHAQWLPSAELHIATYVMAAAFMLLNWRVPGVLLIGVGAAMNGAAIAANGGTLPSDPDAVRRAGRDVDEGAFSNSAPLENPRLAWLGDNYAVPEGWPLANVFSLGDVVIVLGLAYGVHRICTPPEGRRLPWRRREHATSARAVQPPGNPPGE